ncbi:ketoacyl-ACP synthase III [Thiofilum flexile]|uniref:ketoacyl-ACP synthase III n=1 Tax=Thiofilum flexile TaxID=125627 RepID=UPI00036938D8|nr:ketoacyl-ACP synthase III [Thiofilum flexile]
MIGIKYISFAFGKKTIDNIEQGILLDTDKDLIEKKIGVVQRRQLLDEEDTADLASIALDKLFQNSNLLPTQVECLILVTQNPHDKGLPHTASILHDKYNLQKNCATFDISLGCSGFVYGLAIIHSFMTMQKMKNGILVTCDPYSKIIDQADKNTSLLFGDGGTATWLSTDNPIWFLGKFDFGTDGKGRKDLELGSNGLLYMNGRAVFNFSATEVPKSIERTLEINNTSSEEIDQFILHQGSKYLIDTIGKRINATERTRFFAKQYGNLVSSSIPVVLATENLDPYKKILISGFGVGLSWASTILSRKESNYD